MNLSGERSISRRTAAELRTLLRLKSCTYCNVWGTFFRNPARFKSDVSVWCTLHSGEKNKSQVVELLIRWCSPQTLSSLRQQHFYPPSSSSLGDIFNLIKACQRYWFWHFQLRLSLLWAPPAVDLLICDEQEALSAPEHMDEEPLCLPYGSALSAGDTDTWLLLRSRSPPATHN